jgi:hypothetical protein
VIYTRLVSLLILTIARWCLKRGRYVTYTHQGRVYLRRYAIAGHLTGEGQKGLRAYLPNLYLHQMINPDLDPCLHDHPWPWAVSFVALGGYREVRRYDLFVNGPGRTLNAPALNFLRGDTFHRIAGLDKPEGCPWCWRKGSASGCPYAVSGRGEGVWTLFLAGPRRHAKPWGYLVPGKGYVHHSERHAEFGGVEERGEPVRV